LSRPRKTRCCVICGKRFKIQIISKERQSERATCTDECRAILYRNQRNTWHQKEVQLLKELAESMPLAILIRAFNNQNIEQGFKERTSLSIKNKLVKLGFSYEPSYKYRGAYDLAKLLGVSRNTIKYWTTRGLQGQQNRTVRGSPVYYTPENLRKFARAQMQYFGGLKRINLFFALEDEDLVDEILKTYPQPYVATCTAKAVRCVETGRIFRTQAAAALANGTTATLVSRSIRFGHHANGFHFVRINP
jgi:MerR HTH family regulatory protein